MNAIFSLPLEARLAGLFFIGLALGSLLNLAAYRLAYRPRAISPWSRRPDLAPPRRWWDRLPVWGWFGLRRESHLHGAGFWVRPLVVELAVGWLLVMLYWWEVHELGLAPDLVFVALVAGPQQPPLDLQLHSMFVMHVVLISLMIVASLIDIDEKIIPDAVTIPGTLAGLFLATLGPMALLPNAWDLNPQMQVVLVVLDLASPNACPQALMNGANAAPWPLALALACWWMWCFALAPRFWNSRRGYKLAFVLFCARLRRERMTYAIGALGILGTAAIWYVWLNARPASWAGLLSALVGMAVCGGLIWAVRLIGFVALRREAMGFGDVTLMAMIGAFLGWQTGPMIFFLAPFAGLVIALAQWFLRGEKEIPYGPFLCLATLLVIVAWSPIWQKMQDLYEVGWLLPAVMLICFLAMTLLLWIWRLFLNSRQPEPTTEKK